MQSSYLHKVGISVILITLYTIQVQTTVYNEPIISGTEAALGQFPWHVILKESAADELMCGGSIISDSWVLTAAHCVVDETSVFMAFGTISLDNLDINMTSTQFVIDPHYNGSNYPHDIALIQLPTPITFTDYIKPIPLVTSAQAAYDFVGEPAIIMGFGRRSDVPNDDSNVLLWANVEVISNIECDQYFRNISIGNGTMCTKGEKQPNTAICEGDSGGSLVWKNEAGNFIQIAITTFYAIEGCTKNFPSGFTRVNSLFVFIKHITGLALD